jgi:apolipoprotein N-acyltransferase
MKKNLPLAILSGLLLWIAWPPTPYTTFPAFYWLCAYAAGNGKHHPIHSAKKGKQIFNVPRSSAFLFGTWHPFTGFTTRLKQVGNLVAIPVTLIPYSLGPLLMATACWLYYRFRLLTTRGWHLAGLVCLWIGYEYLHQSWDLNFPWMTLGNGFAVAINGYSGMNIQGLWWYHLDLGSKYPGLFNLCRPARGSNKTQVSLLLISGFVLAIILPIRLFVITYYNYTEQVNPSNIVVVQPNIDPYEKEGTIPAARQIDIMIGLSRQVAQPNTEFFLWPETAIPCLYR